MATKRKVSAKTKKAKEAKSEKQAVVWAAKMAGRGAGRTDANILKDASRKGKMAGKGKESRPGHSDAKVKVGKKTYYI